MKMTSKILMAAMLSVSFAGVAMAQTTAQPDPGHPRVNEVDNRLTNQSNREQSGLTQGQATRDEARDAKISNEATADEAKHDGHLTKAEQNKLNRQENRNSKIIKDQKKLDKADGNPNATH